MLLPQRPDAPMMALGKLFVTLWGSWTLYYWAMSYGLNASFGLIVDFIPFFGLLALTLFVAGGRPDALAVEPAVERSGTADWRRILAAWLLPFAITVSALLLDHPYAYLATWVSVALSLAILAISPTAGQPVIVARHPLLKGVEILALLVVLIGVFYATSSTIRADADDGYYVNVIANALAQPGLPIQNTDVLLNTGTGDPVHAGYRSSSYEIAIALGAQVLGTDYLKLYYFWFPLFTVLAWVVFAGLFGRTLGVTLPFVLAASGFLVLLLWGANHYSFGNFAFVRAFQGKAAIAMLAAPMLFYFSHRYMHNPSPGNWLTLLLAAASIAGFSTTGLIIAPAVTGLAMLLYMRWNPAGLKRAIVGAGALLPVLLIFAANILALQANPVPEGVSSGDLEFDGAAFGNHSLKLLVLLLLAWLPLALHQTGNALATRTALKLSVIGLLTLFNPWFVQLLVTISDINLLSWRLQWAYPSALLPALTAAVAIGLLLNAWLRPGSLASRLPASAAGAAMLFWLGLFALNTSPTLALGLNPGSNIGQPKIPPAYWQEVQAIDKMLPGPDAFVLAGVGEEMLPRLPQPPTFVSVRHYLDFYADKLPASELVARMNLQQLVSELRPIPFAGKQLQADWVARAVRTLEVDSLVFSSGALKEGPMAVQDADPGFVNDLLSELQKAGYRCELTPSGYTHVCNI